MKILKTTKRDYIKIIKKIPDHANKLKRQRIINNVLKYKLNQEVYRYFQKQEQLKINNELKKLKFNKLANKNSINQDDLVKIKQYNELNLKTLQKIAQQRGTNTKGLIKENLIYTLIRSEKSYKEDNYIKYINNDTNNEIHSKINEIRLELVNLASYIDKKELNQIRKRLYDIEKKTKINRTEKTKLLNELTKISNDLKYKRKYISNDYRDDNYANLQDIEYIFNSLDDYYKPILAQQVFNNNYQRYYIRGDPTRE